MDMGELIIRFVGSFLFAIAVLYGAYFYLRKNPTALHFGKKGVPLKENLQVESVLPLEARKNLYVIKSGSERFLIATSLEGTQFLSKLEPLAQTSTVPQETPARPLETEQSEAGPTELPTQEPVDSHEESEPHVHPLSQQSSDPSPDTLWEALPPHVTAFLDLQKRVQDWLFKSPQSPVSSEPFPS